MTNKEIREKHRPFTKSFHEIPQWNEFIVNTIQESTRKSERERVIGEIEKWVGENILEVGVARGADLKVVSLFRFKDKLRGLK